MSITCQFSLYAGDNTTTKASVPSKFGHAYYYARELLIIIT
jgi:hypothetical protein